MSANPSPSPSPSPSPNPEPNLEKWIPYLWIAPLALVLLLAALAYFAR